MPEEKHERLFHASEIVIMISGVLFIANVFVIASTGSFTFWVGTVMLYAAGAMLFLLNR